MSKDKTEKIVQTKKKFIVYKYTVVLFDEEDHQKLFECIPDNWFVNELRESCYFPPKTGKSYIQRAISCEKPEDNWAIYQCKVVRGGFLTYNAGFKLVKEKCAQPYNTSSAEEEIAAANFRRKHPALIFESIEHIFLKPTATEISESADQMENTHTIVNEIVNDTVDVHTDVHEPVIGTNSVVVFNNKNNANINKRRVGIDIDKEKNVIPSKTRKIESLKSSAQSLRCPRSRSKDSQSSHRRSNNSGHQQPKNSPACRRYRSNNPGSNDRRSSNSSSQQREILRSPTDSVDSSLTWHHQLSRSSSEKSSKSRSISSRSKNSRSQSNSVQSINSNRRQSTRSRSRSRQIRSSRSQSGSIHRQNSSCGRSTRSSSISRRTRNSRSQSNSVQLTHSSLRQSTHSQSIYRQPRNSRSPSSSYTRRYSQHSSSNRTVHHNGRHSRTVHLGLNQSVSKRNLNIGSESSCSRDRQSRNKKPNANGKKTKGTVSILAERANNSNPSQHPANNNHQSISRSQFNTRNSHSPTSTNTPSVKQLIANVNELTRAVQRNNEILAKNDRRLTRLEVTINKIFITVGDMNGNNRLQEDNDFDPDVDLPSLPIERKTELYIIHRQLQDNELRKLWLNHERNFCCPTKTSTDTVTITKYLKRFISLNVRCQLTLKEPGESGLTLYKDFHRVYLFLIDVMKEGYRVCGKKITRDEVHTALRVVWGRSKQLQGNFGKQ